MVAGGSMARSGGYKDYWSILQVPRGADQAAVKQAFRRLARQYHPDVKPNDKAAEGRFKEINEAYEVLSDPEKRRRYEQFGRFWSGGRGQASGGAGVEMDFQNYGNFDEFINDLLGRFGEGKGSGGFSASGFPRPGRTRPRPWTWMRKPLWRFPLPRRFMVVSAPSLCAPWARTRNPCRCAFRPAFFPPPACASKARATSSRAQGAVETFTSRFNSNLIPCGGWRGAS